MKTAPADDTGIENDEIHDDGNDFIAFLAQIDSGQLLRDATHELTQLLASCKHLMINQGGVQKGKITITIDTAMMNDQVDVYAEVKMKPPKARKVRSIFYVHKNALMPNNPKQITMDLNSRDVSSGGTRPAPKVVS